MYKIIRNVSLFLGYNLDYVNNGYIAINDGIVVDAGIGEYKKNKQNKIVLDGEGLLACPGLINSHTHIGDSIGKDIGIDSSFEDRIHPVYGIKKNILEKTRREYLIQFVKSSAISMIKKGITTFADFREGGIDGIELLKDAISDLPIKSVILGRPEYYFDLSQIKKNKSLLPKHIISKTLKILKLSNGLGISGANENTDESLRQYRELVNKNKNKNKINSILGIHAAESLEAVTKSLTYTGKSEVDRIIDNLHPDFIVHLTNASDDEIDIISRNNIGIVICPRSNGVLGTGIPKIGKMIQSNCCVALGTDNIMLNSPDMFREMDYIWKVSRANERFRVTARDILKMATVNGSKILGINSGCIAPNMSADIVFIDKNNLDLSPMHDPYAALVHRTNENSLHGIMINGNFIDGVRF